MSRSHCFLLMLFVAYGTIGQHAAGESDLPNPTLGPVWEIGAQTGTFAFSGDDVLKANFGKKRIAHQISNNHTFHPTADWIETDVTVHLQTRRLATIDTDGVLEVSHLDSGLTFFRLEIPSNRLKRISFSENGNKLMMEGSAFLNMVNIESGELLWSERINAPTPVHWNEQSKVIEVFEEEINSRPTGSVYKVNQALALYSESNGELILQTDNPEIADGVLSKAIRVTGGNYSLHSVDNGVSTLIRHEPFEKIVLNHPEGQWIDKAHVLESGTQLVTSLSSSKGEYDLQSFHIFDLINGAHETSFLESRNNFGFSERITTFDFSEDESKLVLGTENGSLEIWSWDNHEHVFSIKQSNNAVLELEVYGQGIRCFATTDAGMLHIWNLESQQLQASHTSDPGVIINENETTIIARSNEGYLQVIDASTGELSYVLPAREPAVEAAFYNEDGTLYYTVLKNGVVVTFDSETDELISRMDLGIPFTGAGHKFGPGPHFIGFSRSGIYSINADNGDNHFFGLPREFSRSYSYSTFLSNDGTKLVIQRFPMEGFPIVSRIVHLPSGQDLLYWENWTTSNDEISMSQDGTKALVAIRPNLEDKTLTVSPLGLESKELKVQNQVLYIDIETGDSEILPMLPSGNRDFEFSSDNTSIFITKGLGLERYDLLTGESSGYSVGLISASRSIVVPRQEDSDLILLFYASNTLILDSKNGEAIGVLNEQPFQFISSPSGNSFLTVDFWGKAARLEYREGRIVKTEINGSLTGYDLLVNSEAGYFYKAQTSTNLSNWSYAPGSIFGNGNEQSIHFTGKRDKRRFGRLIAFPIEEHLP